MKKNFLALLCILAMAANGQTQHDFPSLQSDIDTILTKNSIPGMQLVVVDDDSILFLKNFGITDLTTEQRVSDKTIFRIGSISKSFTAIAILQLVEEGLLDLNDKLSDVIPEVSYTNEWENTDPVCVVHLLEHTTGFDDMHLPEYVAVADGWTTLEGVQYHPHSKISRWKPGTQMSYSNSGAGIASYIVEKITGQTIEEYVDSNIFKPLGMKASSYFLTEDVKLNLSNAYDPGKREPVDYWHIICRAAGAINSNALDMSRYLQMLLGEGALNETKIVLPSSIQRLQTPGSTLAAKKGEDEGYGLCMGHGEYRDTDIYSHSGGMPGFLSYLTYIPEKNIGYFFSINKSDGNVFSEIQRTLLGFFIPDSVSTVVPVPATLDNTNIAFEGYYRKSTTRMQILRATEWINSVVRIVEKDGVFYYKTLFGKKHPLYFDNEYTLRYINEHHSATPLVFIEEGKNIFMQMPSFLSNYKKTTGLFVWGPVIGFALAILIIVLTVLYSLFWIPYWIFSRRKLKYKSTKIIPMLASYAFIGFVVAFMVGGMDPFTKLGVASPTSVSIFILSVLFPLLAASSALAGFVSLNYKMNKKSRFFFILADLSCILLAAYMLNWGLVGIRLWVF